ncbi:polysaccharide deacetylase family protein [Nitrospira sp. Nam80]
MICLTGDVHHHSYRGVDTWYSPYSEARLALRYGEIAARHGVKVTLFITGKTCRQEPALVAELSRMPNCEVGGHTYCAFRSPMHWLWKRIGLGVTGPVFFQARDIAKTVRAIERLTGKRIRVWRNHAYRHDQHTYTLLTKAGIEIVSDHVSATATAPERFSEMLLSLPINTAPDHEHLLHGKYLPGRTTPERLSGRVSIHDWLEIVQDNVRAIDNLGGIATILAHPLCMDVADGMQAFEDLCRFLSRYRTGWVSEVLSR